MGRAAGDRVELVGVGHAVDRGDPAVAVEALLSPGLTRRLIARLVDRSPNRQVNAEALAQLTEREREVTALAAHGMSNEEIAVALHISQATAKTHISRAMAKLKARDRAQLVALAYQHRLVNPPDPTSPNVP